MRKRYWLMGTLAVVLMLAAMIPAVALASRPSAITADVDGLAVTSAGDISMRQAGSRVVIRLLEKKRAPR